MNQLEGVQSTEPNKAELEKAFQMMHSIQLMLSTLSSMNDYQMSDFTLNVLNSTGFTIKIEKRQDKINFLSFTKKSPAKRQKQTGNSWDESSDGVNSHEIKFRHPETLEIMTKTYLGKEEIELLNANNPETLKEVNQYEKNKEGSRLYSLKGTLSYDSEAQSINQVEHLNVVSDYTHYSSEKEFRLQYGEKINLDKTVQLLQSISLLAVGE